MRNSAVENIKAGKPFKLWDLVLFLAMGIAVFLLFLFLVILPIGKSADGFKVFVSGKEILSYKFADASYSLSEFDGIVEKVDGDGKVDFYVYLQKDKKDFNVVTVNLTAKSVRVSDANCSVRKDCAHSPEIKDSGVIICAPHNLKILPSSGDVPIVIG